MIKAEIIADSKNGFGDRLTSMVIRFPRFILAEFNTHRVFSRNSASSRAIPFEKMVKLVQEDSFIPVAWQKDHKGMQGTEYFTNPEDIQRLEKNWLLSRDFAVQEAKILSSHGVTKQIVNRLLEPFMWHTVIVTATEWENFFALRCPKYESTDSEKQRFCRSKKDWWNTHPGHEGSTFSEEFWRTCNKGQAEIHMMALAEAMWDAMNESEPKQLQPGEWHIPFGGNINEERLINNLYELNGEKFLINSSILQQAKVEIAIARCARVSYLNYEGSDDYVKDFILFKQLKDSKHMSPFEHCATAMTQDEMDNNIKLEGGEAFAGWCRNFCGFIQYRAMIE